MSGRVRRDVYGERELVGQQVTQDGVSGRVRRDGSMSWGQQVSKMEGCA